MRLTRTIAAPAAAAVVTVAMTVLAAPGAHAGEGAAGTDWRARMLAYVNALRADAGSPPVRMCLTLRRSADAYARSMSRSGVVAHVAPNGSTARDRMAAAGYRADVAGENLAAGQDTVVRVMRAWRRSPSHYATLTDPRLRHVGFGHASADDGVYDEYWVQHFGAGGTCR